jgi:hypothetical protein
LDIIGYLREKTPNPFGPQPYLITPRSDQEKRYGKPTLLLNWELRYILDHLPSGEEPELEAKLTELLGGKPVPKKNR